MSACSRSCLFVCFAGKGGEGVCAVFSFVFVRFVCVFFCFCFFVCLFVLFFGGVALYFERDGDFGAC